MAVDTITMVSFSPPNTSKTAAPVGVQTPSTTHRANRLRQPLESPFPSSSPAGAPSTYKNDDDTTTTYGLSDHHVAEIKHIFQIFDPTLSGYIDISTFETLLHSLGFRVTQDDIVELISIIWDERQNSHNEQQFGFVNNNSSDKRTQQQIDIQMVMQILSNMGYAKRDTEEELRTYFHLFDGGDKGYITVDDLQRVQNEVANGVDAQLSGDDTTVGGVNVVGSDMLQAMIDQFDSGNKGCISYDEFKMILQPVLS